MVTLRKVAWCNLWNIAAAAHSDVGTRIHLTQAEGLTGKTLCGRTFPGAKGYPAAHDYCKHCVNKARAEGHTQGFTKALDWVPSVEAWE